jgi:hypothetical protein
LDDNILPELKKHVQISSVSMASVEETTREKWSIDTATLSKNWGMGIYAAERVHLVSTQRGIKRTIYPSLTKGFKTNDSQLIYRRMPIMLYTDTMHSMITPRMINKTER